MDAMILSCHCVRLGGWRRARRLTTGMGMSPSGTERVDLVMVMVVMELA